MAVRARRTQEERSAETRARLLAATVASLVELGYAGTTTTEVAQRAGVSRGAQLHHFPTKEELVLAAVEHLFERRVAEFRAAFAALPAGASREGAIDLLWRIFDGPTFHAWLELAVAGRTDPTLGLRLRALGRRAAEEIERTYRELFPPPPEANRFYELAPAFSFALLQGLAVERLLVADREELIDDVLGVLKQLAQLLTVGNAAPVAPGGKA